MHLKDLNEVQKLVNTVTALKAKRDCVEKWQGLTCPQKNIEIRLNEYAGGGHYATYTFRGDAMEMIAIMVLSKIDVDAGKIEDQLKELGVTWGEEK